MRTLVVTAFCLAICLIVSPLFHAPALALPLPGQPGPAGDPARLFTVTLFTDTISGTVFNDLAGDAVQGPSDTGLVNWRIRLFSGALEVDSTLSGPGGTYQFLNHAPGSYTVSESLKNGWTQTLPAAGASYSVTLLAGQRQGGNDFGVFKFASIAGRKFNDLSGNGSADPGDTGLANWRIHLFLNSIHVDSTLTSAGGGYLFTNLGPGSYRVAEDSQAGWVRTLPASPAGYTATPQSGETVTGRDFGNFLRASISGSAFQDLNGNGVKDGGDPPLANWRIKLFLGSLHVDSTMTDGSGNYSFANVGPGTYTVAESLQAHWMQTLPAWGAPYTVQPQSGQNVTGRDFGNALSNAVRGTVFYDRNSDGSRGAGEGGLTGWTVSAAAAQPQNSRSSVTQAGGVYSISNLVPDTYTISLIMKANWSQTFPPLSTYTVVVSGGTDTAGFDFGAGTFSDSARFRSFPAESLLVKKSVPRRKTESRWCFAFAASAGLPPVNGLHLVFSRQVDSLTGAGPFPVVNRDGTREFDLSGADIAPGQTFDICGDGSRYGVRVRKWWWTFNGATVGDPQGVLDPASQAFLLPMPNTANLRDEVFKEYFPSGMTVGIPSPDQRDEVGWVVLSRSLSMYNSLITSRGVTHTGPPTGFVSFRGKPFIGRKTTLTPAYHNNRLFADLVALKFNMAVSVMSHTPAGLGELVYEEGANPLSGLTLEQIAARADSNMTFWSDVDSSVFVTLDTVIAKLNAAFNARLDTVSFAAFLKFTPVAPVRGLRFLRPSPETPPIAAPAGAKRAGELPPSFTLDQNYPNPFNPATMIEFEIGAPSVVTLKVYNILGQEVATLIDRQTMDEGPDGVEFDAGSLASGVYFYRLVAEGIPDEEGGVSAKTFVTVKKMLLLK